MSITAVRPDVATPRGVTDLVGAGDAILDDGALEEADDRELIQIIRGDGTAAAGRARRVLTDRYQPLVIGQSATLHRSRGPDHEGVVSVAQYGLQKGLQDYDLANGAPFAAYARAKVIGELMRWFRDDRYSVHVPRPLHERFMQVRRAELESVLHRQPDDDELAAHLPCSVAEVVEAWAVDSAERTRTGRVDDRDGVAVLLDGPDLDLEAALGGLDGRSRLEQGAVEALEEVLRPRLSVGPVPMRGGRP